MLTTSLAIAVLVIAAYGDVRRRLIPNELSIAIAILGLARMIIVGEPISALWTLAAGAGVLFVGFLFFWRGWIGGGDAKLLAAVVLLVGYRELPDLLLVMSLVGGLLAVVVIAVNKLRPILPPLPVVITFCGAPLRLAVLAEEKLEGLLRLIRHAAPEATLHSKLLQRSVPYGVAIAAAGVTVLVFQSSIPG